MLALCLMFSETYYAQNYAGIIYRPGPNYSYSALVIKFCNKVMLFDSYVIRHYN